MSRIQLKREGLIKETVTKIYADLERRVRHHPLGSCPVELALGFLRLCHAQTCGKCVPCRVGIYQMGNIMERILDGHGTERDLELLRETAETVCDSADCAIGHEAAAIVLRGVKGFREDYLHHIHTGACMANENCSVPCSAKCPAHVDIPGYTALIRAGRPADAVRLIRKDNPFPCVCGLICEHPCEENCRRNIVDDAINIRGLKRFAVEQAGQVPVPPCGEKTGKRVAVIGGGPAGLTAAYYLQLMGHSVTVYEKRQHLGGMLRYGIPAYRLPRERLQYDIDAILSTGVEVKMGVDVGTDTTFERLRMDYDSVFIAVGAHSERKLGIPGEDLHNVISAVEMLQEIGDDIYPDYTGKRIVVIGGGNVAMDVARSAVRLGAQSVTVVYRRRQCDMPALPEEAEGAIAEGVDIQTLLAPVRLLGDENGNVTGLDVKPQLAGPIEWGRPVPVPSTMPEYTIPCDLIITAIGQEIEYEHFVEGGVPVRRKVFLAQDDTSFPNLPGIFAGGDCATGPATVIKAVEAGKVAAGNIDEYLGFHHEIGTDVDIPDAEAADREPHGRVNMRERPAAERKQDFEIMEICMTTDEAACESARCLRCDKFGYGNFRRGREWKW